MRKLRTPDVRQPVIKVGGLPRMKGRPLCLPPSHLGSLLPFPQSTSGSSFELRANATFSMHPSTSFHQHLMLPPGAPPGALWTLGLPHMCLGGLLAGLIFLARGVRAWGCSANSPECLIPLSLQQGHGRQCAWSLLGHCWACQHAAHSWVVGGAVWLFLFCRPWVIPGTRDRSPEWALVDKASRYMCQCLVYSSCTFPCLWACLMAIQGQALDTVPVPSCHQGRTLFLPWAAPGARQGAAKTTLPSLYHIRAHSHPVRMAHQPISQVYD